MRTNYPISAASQTRIGTGMFGGSLYSAPPLYSRHQYALPSPYSNHYSTGGVDGSLRSESMISHSGSSSILGGGGDFLSGRAPSHGLPYAMVPTAYTSPLGKKTNIQIYNNSFFTTIINNKLYIYLSLVECLGLRKYKTALVPLFI